MEIQVFNRTTNEPTRTVWVDENFTHIGVKMCYRQKDEIFLNDDEYAFLTWELCVRLDDLVKERLRKARTLDNLDHQSG
jgi:hypothetical protein